MTIKFDNWAEKGDVIMLPDCERIIDEIITCEFSLGTWKIDYIDTNGHRHYWNQFIMGGTLIQFHAKKRYVSCDGIDVTDILQKYGY